MIFANNYIDYPIKTVIFLLLKVVIENYFDYSMAANFALASAIESSSKF